MNPKEISLVLSLVVPCAPTTAMATLAVPVAQRPVRQPAEDKPEPEHPPHGEGSGELPTFVGISASGAMSNVSAAVVTTTSWEPVPSILPDSRNQFSAQRDWHHILKINTVMPRRPFIRIRRSC